MKTVIAITALLAVATVTASSQITGTVRVVDGDTLIMADHKIRLIGVDAPESHQECLDEKHQWYMCGRVAAQALVHRIAGKPVTCEINSQPDRYGRLLGTCWFTDGVQVQSWLVYHGWAVAYRRYSLRYLGEEDLARTQRHGIWRGRFVMPWNWRRGARLN